MIQRIRQAIQRLRCGKQKQQNLVTEEVLKQYNEKVLSKMNIEDYNGGNQQGGDDNGGDNNGGGGNPGELEG